MLQELWDLAWKGFVYQYVVEPVITATGNWFASAPTDCCNGIGGGGDLVQ